MYTGTQPAQEKKRTLPSYGAQHTLIKAHHMRTLLTLPLCMYTYTHTRCTTTASGASECWPTKEEPALPNKALLSGFWSTEDPSYTALGCASSQLRLQPSHTQQATPTITRCLPCPPLMWLQGVGCGSTCVNFSYHTRAVLQDASNGAPAVQVRMWERLTCKLDKKQPPPWWSIAAWDRCIHVGEAKRQ